MGEDTTIRISKKIKERLLQLKEETGRNNYNEVIQDLLTGGHVVNDVITIEREQTAFTLNYWDGEQTIKNDITYKDLKESLINQEFIAYNHDSMPTGDWFNSKACVIAKVNNDEDVILLVTEKSLRDNVFEEVKSVVHVKTF